MTNADEIENRITEREELRTAGRWPKRMDRSDPIGVVWTIGFTLVAGIVLGIVVAYAP